MRATDTSLTLIPVHDVTRFVQSMASQSDVTTPDYYDEYVDSGKEVFVGDVDTIHKLTNNLTDLVGRLNVDQPYFGVYINILRKKLIPLNIMEVVSSLFWIYFVQSVHVFLFSKKV